MKNPNNYKEYQANGLVTRTISDTKDNSRVLAICTNTDHLVYSSDDHDEWFFSEFYLCKILSKDMCITMTLAYNQRTDSYRPQVILK
jgi:siroheme synthase (precorrin-2 oxidase/ferrochelatase)